MQKEDQGQIWSARLVAQKESGLSVVLWCRSEGVTESTFYYWRKRLSVLSSPVTQLIALPFSNRQDAPMLELQTPHGYVIRLSSQAQVGWLDDLLAALR